MKSESVGVENERSYPTGTRKFTWVVKVQLKTQLALPFCSQVVYILKGIADVLL